MSDCACVCTYRNKSALPNGHKENCQAMARYPQIETVDKGKTLEAISGVCCITLDKTLCTVEAASSVKLINSQLTPVAPFLFFEFQLKLTFRFSPECSVTQLVAQSFL